jgi:hypothetical protein
MATDTISKNKKNTMKNKPLLPELTTEERNIMLPTLVRALKLRTSDARHIKGPKLIEWFRANKDQIGYKASFNNARLMKLINHIRVNGILPLCSTNDGYWITRDPDAIREMIQSFENRVASQQAAIQGLKNQLNEIEMEGEFGLFEML